MKTPEQWATEWARETITLGPVAEAVAIKSLAEVIRQAQAEAYAAGQAAMREAAAHLLEFIGCRCDSEDVGPGECSACRHMGAIEDIQTALAEAGIKESVE